MTAIFGRDAFASPAPVRRAVAWNSQFLLVAGSLLLTVLPLLWPTTPPLIDLPNHMSRYRIGLDYATSPYFHQWFDFHWVLVGNMGVDVAVTALAWIVGLEPAVKLVTIAIQLSTVAGMLWIAREAHGRVPWTAAFAFPFAYNFAFNYGFMNFLMAMSLALPAFGLWLCLDRLKRRRLRFALFGPIAMAIWFTHVSGWVVLGILVSAAELTTQFQTDRRVDRALWRTFVACLPLLLPLLPMLGWLEASPGARSATDLPSFDRKLLLMFLSLRNDNGAIDVGSVAIAWLALACAVLLKAVRFDPRVTAAGLLLMLAYLVMPGTLMGAYHADTRIAPYALALLLLSFAPDTTGDRSGRWLGIAGLAFFTLHGLYQTATYARLGAQWDEKLVALDHLPQGSRLFAFAQVGCIEDWDMPRDDHLGRFAIVRRDSFANGTWPPPGSQTLVARPHMIAGYQDDGSQIYVPRSCRGDWQKSLGQTLAELPPGRFNYLWLIGISPASWPHRAGLTPVWQGRDSVLYRISKTI
jgi:hypothetical protein